MFPSAGRAAAALIGSILAPTDSALGLAIFTNRAVPVRIRRALNVESGLNDGIVTPFVTLFLALVVSGEGGASSSRLVEAGKEIGLALVVAIGVGVVGGMLLRIAHRRAFTSEVSEQLAIVSLALLAYFGSVAIGGNGFVAAFVGGLTFGAATRGSCINRQNSPRRWACSPRSSCGRCSVPCSVGPVLATRVDAAAIAYAVLSLTVVRMVPVAGSLSDVGLRRDTVALMGWFGPRGLASVVFTPSRSRPFNTQVPRSTPSSRLRRGRSCSRSWR